MRNDLPTFKNRKTCDLPTFRNTCDLIAFRNTCDLPTFRNTCYFPTFRNTYDLYVISSNFNAMSSKSPFPIVDTSEYCFIVIKKNTLLYCCWLQVAPWATELFDHPFRYVVQPVTCNNTTIQQCI